MLKGFKCQKVKNRFNLNNKKNKRIEKNKKIDKNMMKQVFIKGPVYFLTFFFLTLSSFSSLFSFIPGMNPINAEASITQQTDGSGNTWNVITAGNDINTLLTTTLPGTTLRIKAANDLTLGVSVNMPQNITLIFDMGGHALYNLGSAVIYPSAGDNITFQNETIVATGTSNNLTVPSPTGVGTTSGVYNYYYGLFTSVNVSNLTLTYKNVVQDLGTITNWGFGGQPFYNIGTSVNFSGTNYFNYNSGQEFMEGTGINVLDGSTTIKHSSGGNAPLWPQSAASINISSGSSLDFTGSSTGRGFVYLDNNPTFSINNNGTLNLKMSEGAGNNFYSNTPMSSITMNFGTNSITNITAPGFFDYNATGGAFKTTIGQGASFDYNTSNTTNAFIGNPASTDSLTLNSSNHVRFNTTKTAGGSIFGTDTSAMPIILNASSPSGYAINSYNSSGDPTITASGASGSYGVTGTFHSSLSDLSGLKGIKTATSAEILTYQNSAELEFNLVSPAQANFTYTWGTDVPGQNGVSGTLLGQLPTRVTEQGSVGDTIGIPTLSGAPSGYYISGYKAPNGTIYATLAGALASVNGKYGSTSNSSNPDIYVTATNDFQIILSAQTQTFYINYDYVFTNFGNRPPFPSNIYSQIGLTGAPLSLISLPASPSGYHYSASRNNSGYSWVDQTNPETGGANMPLPYYSTVTAALNASVTQENGGVYFGQISLSSPPSVGQASPYTNLVVLMLTANNETANYSYSWSSNTPGFNGNIGQIQGTLPSNAISRGGFGDTIATNTAGENSPGNTYSTFVAPPTDKNISGYYEKVMGPDGITYTSDPNAIGSATVVKTSTPLLTSTQANTFKEGVAVNDFSVTYVPIANTVTWHYSYDASISNPPAVPDDIVYANILTGAPLTDPSAVSPSDYFIEGYQYPRDSKVYRTVTDLQSAHPSVTSNVTINVILGKNFVLPFTGGKGMVGLISAVTLMIFVALIFLFLNKKKVN